MTFRRTPALRFFVALILCLAGAVVRAEPTLKPLGEAPLPNAFQDKGKYTLRLVYQDPKNDDIVKATFHDESRSGNIAVEKKSVDGSPENGATITWEINGFDKGDHKGYFIVTTDVGETRYPAEKDEFYTFKVESVTDKWIVTVVGWLICLGAVPFLVYILARSLNPRGNPSAVARIGLIVGIFLALALFIWQFMGVYDNPLIWALAVIGFLGLLVAVVVRR